MSDVTIVSNPSEEMLNDLGAMDWPIWEKEVSEFPWSYDAEEVCFLLEDDVEVTSGAGETYHFKAGDLVTFSNGLSCRWKINKAVKKHYIFR